MSKYYAKVIILGPFDNSFDYTYHDINLRIGNIVKVPFGCRTLFGIVVAISDKIETQSYEIKEIIEVIKEYSLTDNEVKFLLWMSAYTLIPKGNIVKMILSCPAALEQIGNKNKRQTIELHEPNPYYRQITYSAEQIDAVKQLNTAVKRQEYQTILVDGVTGSGKTEVYFEVIAAAMENNLQTVVLLPEISLTPQWLARFHDRFGCYPIRWHSKLTPAQRRDSWRVIASGAAKVVVGARSALMLPYARLGLIIVDEEHDMSYKQEDGGIYHARDMAVAKGKFLEALVVLVSATPSLESYNNAQDNKYDRIILSERHDNANMPSINLVDMRTKSVCATNNWISTELRNQLINAYNAREQSLLFLNRRGYAPLTLCGSCGYREQCPSCTSWLVTHKKNERLQCHYCGFIKLMPNKCNECNAVQSFVAIGPGIERIADEVSTFLPQARQIIISSDYFAENDELIGAIDQIQQGGVDIIIGTQIMAKGHHFPNLNLVGIIDADIGLSGGDLRACEKTFQLLQQVSGRCGRELSAHKRGQVYLQTYYPDHPVMQAVINEDRTEFFKQEMLMRQLADMPPFSRLAALICSSKNKNDIENFVRKLRKIAPVNKDVVILGPVQAQIAILRKKHRWRFLIKSAKNYPIQDYIKHWLSCVTTPSHIKIQIDIDPMSFV